MFELDLPSGLIVEASSLKGDDAIAIAERVGGHASGDTIVAFMTQATKRVLDPGPYPFLKEGPGSPPWNRMLWGDLFVALIRLRIASFPEHRGRFEFEFSCPHCRGLAGGEIDLEAFLDDPDHIRELPDESKEKLIADRPFVTKIPSGAEVTFDLARNEQDGPMRVQMKRERRSKMTDVEVVAKRLKGVAGLVSGKRGEPVKDIRGLWEWARKLDVNDIDALLFTMREVDIVVDAQILAWCTNLDAQCGRECRIDLPLDLSFFRPRSGTKRGATGKRGPSQSSSQESPSNGGETSAQTSSGTKPKAPASPSPGPTS